jgi:hypothetical protein
MANLPWSLVLLIGIVVGTLLAIAAIALSKGNSKTSSFCPRCKNETEEERQIRQDWEQQQKGYN